MGVHAPQRYVLIPFDIDGNPSDEVNGQMDCSTLDEAVKFCTLSWGEFPVVATVYDRKLDAFVFGILGSDLV